MPQFTPRHTQPLRPDSYRRLARLVRGFADRIEAVADAQTPQDKRERTMALTGMLRLVRQTWIRNNKAANDASG